ncbi:hypothetical protein ES332_D06G034800v1 [Gossypium tomentosum]|uniref:Uncharacterized protein n=1 Tax=Gossypium tomentosum TaxID=34277 RepID=A0A5D2KDS6_GOSTO|nr:hypothetical protein ES332_D06G034800v1 [Gossypium tomentosum]
MLPNVGATCGAQTAVSHCLGLGWDFGFRLNWAGSKIGYYTFNFKLIQIFVSKAKEKKIAIIFPSS